MKKIFAIPFVLIFPVLFGCVNPQLKPHPVVPSDTEMCQAGCKALEKLPGQDGQMGCLEGRPLVKPDGTEVNCTQFCIETQEAGKSLCPSSWVHLTSCEDIETIRLTCSEEGQK